MAWAEIWRRQGLWWALLLKPLSYAYALGWAGARLFTPGTALKSTVPVISVGNLSVGGTGKSPLVRALAARALSRRRIPAILLRGYGASRGSRPLQISAGLLPLVTAGESGDEAYEHALQVRARVWIDADRRRSAMAAVADGADLLILDDGFQRRGQLRRDLDLLLADWQELQQGEHWLPAGPWREPWTQVAAADAVLLSGAPQDLQGEDLQRSLPAAWQGKPLFRLDRMAAGLLTWPQGSSLSLASLRGKRVAALSGLGRPQSFETSLLGLGAQVLPWRFSDHHAYQVRELSLLPPGGAELIVTTAKDAVRLPADWRPGLPVWVLRVEARISPSKPFWGLVDQALGAPPSKG